jgi:hypothetical protein
MSAYLKAVLIAMLCMFLLPGSFIPAILAVTVNPCWAFIYPVGIGGIIILKYLRDRKNNR